MNFEDFPIPKKHTVNKRLNRFERVTSIFEYIYIYLFIYQYIHSPKREGACIIYIYVP